MSLTEVATLGLSTAATSVAKAPLPTNSIIAPFASNTQFPGFPAGQRRRLPQKGKKG